MGTTLHAKPGGFDTFEFEFYELGMKNILLRGKVAMLPLLKVVMLRKVVTKFREKVCSLSINFLLQMTKPNSNHKM